MAFLVSPGVQVREIDLTNIVPAVSTSIGAYAGHFGWGPVGDVVNLSSEKDLARNFGAPSKALAESYFNASTFLRYGNTLLVSRAIDEENATNATTDGNPTLIKNIEQYNQTAAGSLTDKFYARCPGALGNSLQVLVQPAGVPTRVKIVELEILAGKKIQITLDDENDILTDGLSIVIRSIRSRKEWVTNLENQEVLYLTNEGAGSYAYQKTFDIATDASGTLYDPDSEYPATYLGTLPVIGDVVTIADNERGFIYSPPEAENFETAFVNAPGTSAYAEELGATNDEINVLVIDTDGSFSEAPGTIIERFGPLSVASDAKKEDGSTNFYKDVINTQSRYIIVDNLENIVNGHGDSIKDDGTTSFTSAIATGGSVYIGTFTGGADGTSTGGDVYDALELFEDAETLDVNLIFAENDAEDEILIANKLITICENRKDCVAFISPDLEVKDQSTEDAKLDKVLRKFDRLPSTSYAVFDSSPLYVYDKYNDEYIWVPASGSTAGLCARTDDTRDPWWSPAGYNRGQLLGVAKLAFNPKQNQRDELYKSRVNPLVTFPGEGTILFGDKTAQAKPSAFDRINVRRLFIVLEKAIAIAAKYQLFEFNDEFTRAQFRNLVEPYLRDIQGRRGITDFRVVCDETNNTGEVIDSNRFVADIYIKPARAINFITLNFIATRTGVEFEEVIGQFG
jgi:phage tail sheath protein FI